MTYEGPDRRRAGCSRKPTTSSSCLQVGFPNLANASRRDRSAPLANSATICAAGLMSCTRPTLCRAHPTAFEYCGLLTFGTARSVAPIQCPLSDSTWSGRGTRERQIMVRAFERSRIGIAARTSDEYVAGAGEGRINLSHATTPAPRR